MKGIRIDSAAPFAELVSRLSAEIERLFWLLDLQSGPFNYLQESEWEELDRELEEYYVDMGDVDAGEMPEIAGSLWRPGIFPRFAPLLVHDEWSYIVGLDGPEDRARMKAKALCVPDGYLSPDFFEALEEHGQFFAVLAYDSWEVYSPKAGWLSRLSRQWQSRPVASSKWAVHPEGNA